MEITRGAEPLLITGGIWLMRGLWKHRHGVLGVTRGKWNTILLSFLHLARVGQEILGLSFVYAQSSDLALFHLEPRSTAPSRSASGMPVSSYCVRFHAAIT